MHEQVGYTAAVSYWRGCILFECLVQKVTASFTTSLPDTEKEGWPRKRLWSPTFRDALLVDEHLPILRVLVSNT